MKTIEIVIPDHAEDARIVETVEKAAQSAGLLTRLRTSTKTYPGSIHWHFRKQRAKRGTLELTYWPRGRRLWAKIQSSRNAEWVTGSLEDLTGEFSRRIIERLKKSPRLD